MSYGSKYVQLTPMLEDWQKSGWNEADLALVVEKLETASKGKLLEVCKFLGLKFSDGNWEETTPEEQIILAIIGDYKPETVMRAVKKLL